MKYTIEWHGNAGNYFLFKEQGGTVSLDPNSEDGKDIINRLNSYDEMQQRIAQLEEALTGLLSIVCYPTTGTVDNFLKQVLTADDLTKIEKAKSLLK